MTLADRLEAALDKMLTKGGLSTDNDAAYAAMLECREIARSLRSERAAWIAVTERLPENGKHVIAFTREGERTRRIRAFHCAKHTVAADEETINNDCADYVEAEDEFYLRPGWYEENENEETFWFVTDPVTHWTPLPEGPA